MIDFFKPEHVRRFSEVNGSFTHILRPHIKAPCLKKKIHSIRTDGG